MHVNTLNRLSKIGTPIKDFIFVPIVRVFIINAPLPHFVHAKVCSVAEPFAYLILGLIIEFLPPLRVVDLLLLPLLARDLFLECFGRAIVNVCSCS
jgi:hypothetical protein